MLCKNCGAEIADTTKFCGSCGSKVEDEVQSNESNLSQVDESNSLVEESLQSLAEIPAEESLKNEGVATENLVSESPESNDSNKSKGKKKNNTLLFVILGLVIIAIIAAGVFFGLKFFQKDKTIDDFKKSLNSMKDAESVTVNLNMSVKTNGLNIDLGGSSKVQKKGEKYLLDLALNKSLFFDKIELYAVLDSKGIELYVPSTAVDLLGSTSSDELVWLNFKESNDEYKNVYKTVNGSDTVDVDNSVFDDKHFKYVETKKGEDHYQLIIDKEMLNKLENTADIDLEEVEELPLEKDIVVDLYVKNSYLRIELDLTSFASEEVVEGKMTLELVDINKTKIEIPEEALKSTKSLDEYISENSIETLYDDEDYDYDFEDFE